MPTVALRLRSGRTEAWRRVTRSARSRPGAIVIVTPHGRALAARRGWTTRPAQLAGAIASNGRRVVVVSRTPPWRSLGAIRSLRLRVDLGPFFEARDSGHGHLDLLEHPVPAGGLEARAVARAVARMRTRVDAVVVSDPRSARVLQLGRGRVNVFDAYDAWDLSPLFGSRTRRQIREGYRIAAAHADLIVANTPFMVERMRALGAANVRLLPNAGPEPVPGGSGRDIVYVGNVQSRLRIDLLAAAAEAAAEAGVTLRIVGVVQDRPHGWDALLSLPAVQLIGPIYPPELDGVFASAAVGLIPHRVDDYTRSQDSMKAWDYLGNGLAVVATPVPPATNVPGLARVADDPVAFARAVADALSDRDVAALRARRVLAGRHTWRRRASELIGLIDELEG